MSDQHCTGTHIREVAASSTDDEFPLRLALVYGRLLTGFHIFNNEYNREILYLILHRPVFIGRIRNFVISQSHSRKRIPIRLQQPDKISL